ncbi:XkdX family protein [Paenibacillus spongiae]
MLWEVVRLFETLQRLRNEGRLTDQQVQNAVIKGWITTEQANQINGLA